MTKKERRKVIAKRESVRKLKLTWERKKRERGEVPAKDLDDYGGTPETDAALDELPDGLVG